VQEEARSLVRASALQRAHTAALSARGLSDFVRVDRAEGLALGGGITQRLGGGFSVGGRIRYGVDDHAAKGQARFDWQNGAGTTIRFFGLRDYRELGEEAERSRAVNSLAAQEFASDYSDPYLVQGGGVAVEHAPVGETLWRLEGAIERPSPLSVRGLPVEGRFLGLVDVPTSRYERVSLRVERGTSLWVLGTELRSSLELRATHSNGDAGAPCIVAASCPLRYTTLRGSLTADIQRPIGSQRLVLHTIVGAATAVKDTVPAQELFYFGGPVTAPGYEFHQLIGRTGLSQRAEWRTPIPFVAIPLGRFGNVPASATLAPYAQVVLIGGRAGPVYRNGQPLRLLPGGAYPAVGAGLLSFFDLVRFDVSRGLRDGRWLFAFDVNPEFWSIL
jgi:hypothetical protein